MNELILVVDDSALMRKHIGECLRQEGFRVEIARNGQECLEKLKHFKPHAITLDINMPVMDGLTCLSHIMAADPCPTIMLSSLTKRGAMATIEAIQLGAIDYVCKPSGTVSLDIQQVFPELITKVQTALKAKPRTNKSPTPTVRSQRPAVQRQANSEPSSIVVSPTINELATIEPSATTDLVLVGVSTGGPSALEELLKGIPANFKAPIVIAQHMPATFTHNLAKRLNGIMAIEVVHVDRVTRLEAGKAYIARGDADAVIQRRDGRLVMQPTPSSEHYLWHPSVSRLVDSAASAVQANRLICVQMTGMGNDGAKEMASLKHQGAMTIAEAEETAVVFGMPKELIKMNGASCVLPNHRIGEQLTRWVMHSA